VEDTLHPDPGAQLAAIGARLAREHVTRLEHTATIPVQVRTLVDADAHAVPAVMHQPGSRQVRMLAYPRVQLVPHLGGAASDAGHLGDRLQYPGKVLVDAGLEGGRRTVHRPGARHVAPVTVNVAPRVDDVQLAVLDGPRSCGAPELGGAEVAVVEVHLAAVALRGQLALRHHLQLRYARPYDLLRAGITGQGRVDRALNAGDLVGVFSELELLENVVHFHPGIRHGGLRQRNLHGLGEGLALVAKLRQLGATACTNPEQLGESTLVVGVESVEEVRRVLQPLVDYPRSTGEPGRQPRLQSGPQEEHAGVGIHLVLGQQAREIVDVPRLRDDRGCDTRSVQPRKKPFLPAPAAFKSQHGVSRR